MTDNGYHVPVLLKETVDSLAVKADGLYVDGTLGGGGHTEEILKRGGRICAFDRDKEAIAFCAERFEKFPDYVNRYTLIHGNFKSLLKVLNRLNIEKIDGAVLDLGFSSRQIAVRERGFSYAGGAVIDMRMDQSQDLSAKTVLNEYSEKQLVKILYQYGEERYAPRIVKEIIKARAVKPIETTDELVNIAIRCYPPFYKGGHPAKRIFQALRIEVNGELEGLSDALKDFVSALKAGARLSVISFHSLEDRIVKQTFRDLAESCVCPKSLPICVCGKRAEVRLIGKGTRPTEKEIEENSRSKSATLRVCEKI